VLINRGQEYTTWGWGYTSAIECIPCVHKAVD
jgi:hypothetical protein